MDACALKPAAAVTPLDGANLDIKQLGIHRLYDSLCQTKSGHRLVRHASRDHETGLRVAPHSMPDYQIVNNRMCYTGHATVGKPRRSSKPKTMLAHWTAWPAAPCTDCRWRPSPPERPPTLVEREADLGGVGTDNRSRLGLLTGIEYAHEGATGVELLVMVDNVLKGQGTDSLRRKRHRHRGEQAALERCQMRGKDDAIGQAKDSAQSRACGDVYPRRRPPSSRRRCKNAYGRCRTYRHPLHR